VIQSLHRTLLLGLLVASVNFIPSLLQASDANESPTRQFTYSDAAILGLVEGITEYLPVSSTGHLILTNAALGLDSETPLLNRDGEILWIEDSESADGQRPFTLSNAADAYAIIIQFGAILAVVILYWKRLLTILMGVLGKDPDGLRLLRNLVVAFLPAAGFGLLLDDWIEAALFGIIPVVIALVAGSLLMLAVEFWHRRKNSNKPQSGPDLHELSTRQCLTVGCLQCLAMWPGTSRSMMTIVGGYLIGLSPVRAAEFSFLLGLITLSAASAYKALSVGPQILQTVPLGPLLLGIAVATVSAALAVKWLVTFLTRHGLSLFAWYRLGLAALVLLTFA
jgi:undecaprenyl-diphosphatase